MLRRPAARAAVDSGRQGASSDDASGHAAARPLPLEARVDGQADGWSVRLPVRTEEVAVTKESILVESVRVVRIARQGTESVQARVRSEHLTVEEEPTQYRVT